MLGIQGSLKVITYTEALSEDGVPVIVLGGILLFGVSPPVGILVGTHHQSLPFLPIERNAPESRASRTLVFLLRIGFDDNLVQRHFRNSFLNLNLLAFNYLPDILLV